MERQIIGFTFHKISSCYYHINYDNDSCEPFFQTEIKLNLPKRYIISFDKKGKLLLYYPEQIIGKNYFKYK